MISAVWCLHSFDPAIHPSIHPRPAPPSPGLSLLCGIAAAHVHPASRGPKFHPLLPLHRSSIRRLYVCLFPHHAPSRSTQLSSKKRPETCRSISDTAPASRKAYHRFAAGPEELPPLDPNRFFCSGQSCVRAPARERLVQHQDPVQCQSRLCASVSKQRNSCCTEDPVCREEIFSFPTDAISAAASKDHLQGRARPPFY